MYKLSYDIKIILHILRVLKSIYILHTFKQYQFEDNPDKEQVVGIRARDFSYSINRHGSNVSRKA